MNYLCATGAVTIYIRYRHIGTSLDGCLPSKPLYRVSKASLAIGMLASSGISIVGNFQVIDRVLFDF